MMHLGWLKYPQSAAVRVVHQELQAQITPAEYRKFSQEAEQEQLSKQNPPDNYPYPLKSR
jgi:hypothetical protein